MAKYDFIVRNWWCLNDVRIRFVRCVCAWPEPEPGDATDESYDRDSIDDDNSEGWRTSVKIIVISKCWYSGILLGGAYNDH